ncbi:NADH dehydrogenase subunit i, partial [Listeria monocytogenes FSL F2-208]
ITVIIFSLSNCSIKFVFTFVILPTKPKSVSLNLSASSKPVSPAFKPMTEIFRF